METYAPPAARLHGLATPFSPADLRPACPRLDRPAAGAGVTGGAWFDPTGAYRYRLWRDWDDSLPRVGFILLNPSTADATADDPTLKRCLGFARRWGYGALEVGNLFALRATSPRTLIAAESPVGPHNDQALRDLVRRVQALVVGWGNGGRCQGRAASVAAAGILPAGTLCLGNTRSGQPRHPLYVRGDTVPVPFRPGAASC